MVQTGRFAFDDGWTWDPRDWGREWDDLGDEFPPDVEDVTENGQPSEVGESKPDVDPGQPHDAPPRRHLADADWLKPRTRRRRRAS